MTTFMGFDIVRDGYGHLFNRTAKELKRTTDWRIVDMCQHPERHGKPNRYWTLDDTTIALCLPTWLNIIYAKQLVSFTMFEATQLPTGWANMVNDYASALIVPSQWCADVYRNNGVTVPIHVCKLGIDPDEYKPIERNHDGRPYTFLWSGTPDKRKGWDVVYQAFWQAFRGDRSVKLVLHFRENPKGVPFSDTNIESVTGMFYPERINQMLADADCFVFPSRGEGWGLPPREAAATGLPVIATNYGGLAEDISDWALPLSITHESKADYGAWNCDLGNWGEPSVNELAEKMRFCFENQEIAARFGQNAAHWLHINQTWAQTAQRLQQIAREL